MAKKKTSTTSKKKKKPAKSARGSAGRPQAKDKATEIDFLRKITKKDFDASTPKERRVRLSLRDKLLDINFGAPATGGGGLIVLELMLPEVDFLQHITKEVYSFVTAEERRARLILREKILIAVEKVTGKKIQLEEAP